MISDIWRGHIERWADEWCQIIEVYLFGSWAKGDNHSKSDVDIGVILRQKAVMPKMFGTIITPNGKSICKASLAWMCSWKLQTKKLHHPSFGQQ